MRDGGGSGGCVDVRVSILEKRGALCENCGTRTWTELHHCLVHDSKRLHKQVTVEENLMAVCRRCHSHLNGHEVRVAFAKKQVERGYDICAWYNSLNMKNKESWLRNL